MTPPDLVCLDCKQPMTATLDAAICAECARVAAAFDHTPQQRADMIKETP